MATKFFDQFTTKSNDIPVGNVSTCTKAFNRKPIHDYHFRLPCDHLMESFRVNLIVVTKTLTWAEMNMVLLRTLFVIIFCQCVFLENKIVKHYCGESPAMAPPSSQSQNKRQRFSGQAGKEVGFPVGLQTMHRRMMMG